MTPLRIALGVAPVYLKPGGSVRLNPLDPRVGNLHAPPEQVCDAQLQVLLAIAAAALGRRLSSEEQGACGEALLEVSGRSDEPTLPQVVADMLEPTEASAQALRTSPRRLAERTREAALALRRMVEGDLAGMFDGPTSGHQDLTAAVVSLNLRSVYESDALPILMVCPAAWLKRAVELEGENRELRRANEILKSAARFRMSRSSRCAVWDTSITGHRTLLLECIDVLWLLSRADGVYLAPTELTGACREG